MVNFVKLPHITNIIWRSIDDNVLSDIWNEMKSEISNVYLLNLVIKLIKGGL